MKSLQAKFDASKFEAIFFDSQRLRADGKSFCEVKLIVTEENKNKPVNLRLTAGSFSPDEKVRSITIVPVDGEVRFNIYAPSFPRGGYLIADGLRAPLQFSPTGFLQYLTFDLIPNLAVAVVLALIVRSFALASYYIPSGSMEPTLMVRDRLLADRFSYTFHLKTPKRGDIMIFRYPGDPSQDFIKRVVALPGERVRIEGGRVYVNDEPLDEPYIAEVPYYDMEEQTVPEKHYFVLGDNRNRSADSHIWGFVPEKNIVGRALMIYWPLDRMQVLRNPFAQSNNKEN